MVPMDVVISSAELATVWTLELAWLAAVATALALAVVSLAACDSVSALLFKRTADDATLWTTLATRSLNTLIFSSR